MGFMRKKQVDLQKIITISKSQQVVLRKRNELILKLYMDMQG